jgi:hypothetical protein
MNLENLPFQNAGSFDFLKYIALLHSKMYSNLIILKRRNTIFRFLLYLILKQGMNSPSIFVSSVAFRPSLIIPAYILICVVVIGIEF